LPPIDVSAAQGKMLHLLARMAGARHILELGTLGGYSTIWLARALPADGRLVTIELDPHHAEVARGNIASAGFAAQVDLRVGPALDLLDAMIAAGEGPFDFVFIDADKPNNVAYLKAAIALSRPGTTIIVDNVVREGGVLDAASDDPRILGTRALFEAVAAEPRLSATAVQTVGAKKWDGFLLAVLGAAA
jgi:predicted O-methyltransferase YrrM